ncbi:MAG: type III-B CRISPR module RAMP protein Cmr6 [Clostridia bacterium]|nr:type III-B CRISPR module RAMP protein Cmr6 [Clostridia bacterium]
MAVPLYNDGEGVPQKYDKGFNTGLWYDKFFNQWEEKWSIPTEGKRNWIEQVARKKEPVGDEKLIREMLQRHVMLVRALNGKFQCYETVWRFVTGLGYSNPIENGFAWHHTLGVPYLPGSSVKGIVRAWAEEWGGALDQEIQRIFGPRGEGEIIEKSAGSVIFFDALPTKPVQMDIDVMTPHYQQYYMQKTPELAPGDWYDPNPIPFLTVAEKQTFVFAVAPRSLKERDCGDAEKALEWLSEALSFMGAGAKTAAGYGRFRRNEGEEAKIAYLLPEEFVYGPKNDETQEESSAGPIEREMIEDGYRSDEEAFMRAMNDKWLKKLEDKQVPIEEKKEIAVLLKGWYQQYRKGQWEKPNRKNKKKIALIKKVLGEQ